MVGPMVGSVPFGSSSAVTATPSVRVARGAAYAERTKCHTIRQRTNSKEELVNREDVHGGCHKSGGCPVLACDRSAPRGAASAADPGRRAVMDTNTVAGEVGL
ncbi:hypothetical protein Mro03_67590 [Microbispora rosea subsp. rosea]|nr:hypothetical protein Mro03_67590 [Microbispora rosea subsp. rosea]